MDDPTLKRTLKLMLLVARRKGYMVDDETRSLAGWCVALALRKWDKQRGASFPTLCVVIFLRSLSLLDRFRRKHKELAEDIFVSRHWGRDVGQAILMRLPEPGRSICFAVWIERRDKAHVAAEHGMTVKRLENILASVSKEFVWELEDTP